MSYSVNIFRITKNVLADTYATEAVSYSDDYVAIPDSVIRNYRIDDASVDPADMFATIGRKCTLTLSLFGNNGWLSDRGHAHESHPDYVDWYPFIFVLYSGSDPIFIGGMKKSNYKSSEVVGSEEFVLSDAVDIFIDIIKNDKRMIYTPVGYVTLADVASHIQATMKRWPIMNESELGAVPENYQVNDILIKYPGIDALEFPRIVRETENESFWTPRLCVFAVGNFVKVSSFVVYKKKRTWRGRGITMNLRGYDIFNIPNIAYWLNNSFDGYSATSESSLYNLLYFNSIIPTPSFTDNSFFEIDGNSVYALPEGSLFLSGTFKPLQQTFSELETLLNITKAMLVINTASMRAINVNTGTGAKSIIRIESKINPSIDITSSDLLTSKDFTPSEITHIEKKGMGYSDRMFSSLDPLLDADIKKTIMPIIYKQMLENFRFLSTFSTHSGTAGVSSLTIGDAVTISPGSGKHIITGISDTDENGMITITVAGGY